MRKFQPGEHKRCGLFTCPVDGEWGLYRDTASPQCQKGHEMQYVTFNTLLAVIPEVMAIEGTITYTKHGTSTNIYEVVADIGPLGSPHKWQATFYFRSGKLEKNTLTVSADRQFWSNATLVNLDVEITDDHQMLLTSDAPCNLSHVMCIYMH